MTERNLWFLERSIPLFGILDFFPPDSIGALEMAAASQPIPPAHKLTIDTDQGWSFTTDIAADQKVFRNRSRNRGTGKWVRQAALKPGDRIVIRRIGEYHYRLLKESIGD